jgi:hypothetical protein
VEVEGGEMKTKHWIMAIVATTILAIILYLYLPSTILPGNLSNIIPPSPLIFTIIVWVVGELKEWRYHRYQREHAKVQSVYQPLHDYLQNNFISDVEKAFEHSIRNPKVQHLRLSNVMGDFYAKNLLSPENSEDECLKEDINELIKGQYSIVNDPLKRPEVYKNMLEILGKIKKKIRKPLSRYGNGIKYRMLNQIRGNAG